MVNLNAWKFFSKAKNTIHELFSHKYFACTGTYYQNDPYSSYVLTRPYFALKSYHLAIASNYDKRPCKIVPSQYKKLVIASSLATQDY